MTIDEIRKAVSVARYYDQQAKIFKAQVQRVVKEDKLENLDWLVDVECGANNLYYSIETANAVRRAIRAAIGSEKT